MKTRSITLNCDDCGARLAHAGSTRGASRSAKEHGARVRHGRLRCKGCDVEAVRLATDMAERKSA